MMYIASKYDGQPDQSNLPFLCYTASESRCVFVSAKCETGWIPQDSVIWKRQQRQK